VRTIGLICLEALFALAAISDARGVLAQGYPAGIRNEFAWRLIGPFRGGRTRAVTGVASQPHVFYVGAVDGGVWKTDDAGRTWHPIFDAEPTQSIGAIAVAPSDPNLIYVASGEGLRRPDLSVGDGMYRSADGGRTWTHLGLDDSEQIAALAVDPRDARRVFAAVLGHPYGPNAERGIYRSLDGGVTWQKVLYKDPDTGGSAVAIDPRNPDVLYAALWQSRLGPWEDRDEYDGTGGGLFKSTDGGMSWKRLTAGLPKELSQINIAVAPSAPERLYAVVGTNEPGDYSSAAGLGIFRSDDAGASWRRITTDPRPALRIGGGDLPVLRVDPADADILFSASLVTMKSIDGGRTWEPLRGAPGGDDYQNLWINPRDPQIIALVGDQGAVVTLNGGRTWSSWFNQPTAQLYHVSVTPTFPYRVCGGQQESGSVCISSRGNDGEITVRDWHPVGAIEYGSVAPDPLDPDLIYGAGRNEVSKFHCSTGQVENVTPIPVRGPDVRVDRTEPLVFSPLDPHLLYYAADRVYATRDGGVTWRAMSPDLARPAGGAPPSVGRLHEPRAERQRGVVYALAPSSLDSNLIWAGTDDGLIWTTRDGGAHWSNVTPRELTPWSKVTQIEASHFDARRAYVSVSRMRLDDMHPYILRTDDGGRTWQSLVGGLPDDAPVNAVREDPVRRGLLYAATERAVWMSSDDGAHWESLELNLPHTSMRDLAVHGDDLIVATHGRSFWILDDISRLRELSGPQVPEPVLLHPAVAYRVRRSTWTDTPIPPDEPLAANPPAGAIIEYYLPRDAKGPLTLEILGRDGALVRRYRSNDALEPSAEQLARELIPRYWIALPRALPSSRGMHRWVWDLRYPAPLSVTQGYPISAAPHATPRGPQGPLVPPGDYRVRLSVDGRSLEVPLVVKEDPRVTVSEAALERQFGLARSLADSLGTASRALLAARSEQQQIRTLAATGPTAAALKRFAMSLARLAAQPAEESESKPSLAIVEAAIGELYADVTRADAAPTAAELDGSNREQAVLADLLRAWGQLQSDLPALNARLAAAGLAKIRPDLARARDVNVADQD